MDNLKDSFEDVADWCEKHLEALKGREVGMIFGAMIRVYGRLATLPSHPHGEERSTKVRQWNAKAEELLSMLRIQFLGSYDFGSMESRIADVSSHCTNMMYDTGQFSVPETAPPYQDDQDSQPRQEYQRNSSRFEILYDDMGGWVRVYLGRGEPTGEVAKFLSDSLAEWMRRRPHLRIRFVVPISRDGDTAEIHRWYDQVLFPDTSTMANPESNG